MKKIIVTGGAGYIGSHTVLALIQAGYTPIIVDNFCNAKPEMIVRLQNITGQNIQHYPIDCSDKKALQAVFEKEDHLAGVIHFAALKAVGESLQIPNRYYANNLISLLNVLDLILDYPISRTAKQQEPFFIFSSSATVYGKPLKLPVTEESPLEIATNPYGASKQMGERMIQDFVKANSNYKAVILRYFNPIGAHGEIGETAQTVPNNLVPYLALAAAGKLPFLPVFGQDYNTPDGTCIRDYIDVRDLAQAHVKSLDFLLASQAAATEAFCFNIGLGKGYSVLECIRTFEQVNGVVVPFQMKPRRLGDVSEIYADNRKALQDLKWHPQYALADSLKKVWEWTKHLEKFSL